MANNSPFEGLLDAVPYYSTFVDIKNYMPGCMEIVNQVRPQWNKLDVKIKLFNTGHLNRVFGCYVTDFKDAIVIRVFGDREQMDVAINRKQEILIGHALAENGVSPEIYCVFQNGICTRLIDGKAYSWEPKELFELRNNEKACRAMVKTMATLHGRRTRESLKKYGVEIREEIHQLKILHDLHENQYPDLEKITDNTKKKRITEEFPTKSEFYSEIEFFEKISKNSTMKPSYITNDANPTNFVYNIDEDKAYMVDLELCGTGYAGYDLGFLFSEIFFGLELNPESFLPEKEWQRKLVKCYLETAHDLENDQSPVTDEEIERMEAETLFGIVLCLFVLGFFIFTNSRNEKEFFATIADDLTWSKAELARYFKIKEYFLSSNEYKIISKTA